MSCPAMFYCPLITQNIVIFYSIFLNLIDQTVSFDFDFEVTKKSDGQVVSGLVSIGEPLHFTLSVRSNLSTIKTSPQECFATRLDGTGVYDFIQDR